MGNSQALGSRSTADDVVRLANVDLTDKYAIVTGANTGIGKQTAITLAKSGAAVVVGCRDQQKVDATVNEIKAASGRQDDRIFGIPLELASLKSVKAFAKAYLEKGIPLHYLILNAGLISSQAYTEDGFEMMFGVNHIGHFLLTNLLLDLVKKSAPAKIVVLSSEAHRLWASMHWDDLDAKKHFSMWGRYGQSKLANLHFAKELQRRLDNEGVTNVTVNAVHPGAIRSDLGLRISSFANWINATIGVLFFKSVEQGAATTLYVAVHPDADNAKGLYFADCAVCEPASYAKDPESAKRLWDVSEELVHLKEALSDIKK